MALDQLQNQGWWTEPVTPPHYDPEEGRRYQRNTSATGRGQ